VFLIEFPTSIDITGASCSGTYVCNAFPTMNVLEVISAPVGGAGSFPALDIQLFKIQEYDWGTPVLTLY